MTRATIVHAEHGRHIEDAVDRFGDHEGMTQGHVLKWLLQFEDNDLPLAVKILETIMYLNAINIRAMTSALFDMVVARMAAEGLMRAAFVAVGSAASGSGNVARALRDALRGSNHVLISMLDFANADNGDFDAVVFVDDFSGTGETLSEWWENVESVVRPKNAQVFAGLLIVTAAARDQISDFAEVLAVDELDVTRNALADESMTFSDEEKVRIRHYCDQTGVDAELRSGYGQCGLLLAFRHGSPDNSLPIIWANHDNWWPLFRRRAI